MGYYTNFTITAYRDLELKVKEDEEILDMILTNNKTPSYVDYNFACIFMQTCKWYSEDRLKDMKYLSKLYPHLLFELYGEGEEAGDLWYEYYHNGKIHRCPAKVTFDDFDPTKLKPIP